LRKKRDQASEMRTLEDRLIYQRLDTPVTEGKLAKGKRTDHRAENLTIPRGDQKGGGDWKGEHRTLELGRLNVTIESAGCRIVRRVFVRGERIQENVHCRQNSASGALL